VDRKLSAREENCEPIPCRRAKGFHMVSTNSLQMGNLKRRVEVKKKVHTEGKHVQLGGVSPILYCRRTPVGTWPNAATSVSKAGTKKKETKLDRRRTFSS